MALDAANRERRRARKRERMRRREEKREVRRRERNAMVAAGDETTDAFLEFAGPLVRDCRTAPEIRRSLEVAEVVWNAEIVDTLDGCAGTMERIRRRFVDGLDAREASECLDLLDGLARVRREEYSAYRDMIEVAGVSEVSGRWSVDLRVHVPFSPLIPVDAKAPCADTEPPPLGQVPEGCPERGRGGM